MDLTLLPKDNELESDLARAWIAFQYVDRESADRETYNALFWTFERMSYLTNYLPEKAWRLILLIWSMDQSDKIAQSLSAGPLEALLSNHGPTVIDAVEEEARRDLTFAGLLGGVWQHRITDDVWRRVQAVWDRTGWDGIPAIVN